MNTASKIKILFCTPFAGYTGSEVMLFNMLKNIDLEKFDVAVFSLHKGELLDTLSDSIPTYYYKRLPGLLRRIKNKIQDVFSGKSALERQLLSIQKKLHPDIWYLNTLLLNEMARIAQKYSIKYAVHFHELSSQYKYIPTDDLQKMLKGSLFTVGCCECVCENLRILGAPNIQKQYECFEAASISLSSEKEKAIRQQLTIPEGHAVITMSGQRTNRKGVDLFIEVAKELSDKPYSFLWLGAKQNSGDELLLEKYITHHKIKNINFIHPARKDYYNYLNLTNIFFLSSREDPFPLVMLEAAYLEKFIVSLDSGGVSEFLNQDTGYIIKSWNIKDIANGLDRCVQNHATNKVSKSKEEALKFDVINQIKQFEKLLLNELTH